MAGIDPPPAAPEEAATESQLDTESLEEVWLAPPFQPLRVMAALALTASGFALYQYVLRSFWWSPALGMHDRIAWPAYGLLALALVLTLAAIRVALGIWSPHAKLGVSILAMGVCAVVAVDGGRFVSYTFRGALLPPFDLQLKVGDRFPNFALADQKGAIHHGAAAGDSGATLIYVYRGDYCPFARFELHELTERSGDFHRAGVNLVALSADPVERSIKLANFLDTDIPLLSDAHESILAPLGLVQHHRNGEPDNAIPAFFMVDRAGVVRWIFTSKYYRELPTPEILLQAGESASRGDRTPPRPPAPAASPS
ncbi:MAG TPA: redoxin domain-containing protein [Candidatus Binataceae bacterium]